jgi:signal transduction histidine kinase/CheY-like chemotaxis protein
MVADIEKLQKQVENLKEQLAKEKKTNQLLKKRALQAIIGTNGAARQNTCEVNLVRAELSSRAKSLFLENVSHEIRSSMNGIIGMTDLVLETELSSEQRQYLEMVASSVDRLLVVVNEVLDFSRIETGELELDPEDFNIKESLDHDLYVLNLAAQKKDLELVCTLEPDVPANIHGDATRLVQIITNLVNNGIKFTTRGGVYIKIENNGYDSDNNILLRFSIRDTGCGITPDKLDLINHYFKENAQSQIALPLSMGTTGLGLTIASQLVKLMGGEIVAESSPEETTFRFILPFKELADLTGLEEKTNATLEGIEEEVAFALRGAKVLLAEDEFINRVLIETILKQLGVEVTSVSNGQQAVSEACTGEYQVVLMDVQMEDMDGLEATRRIRKYESKHGGHVTIIALTALAMSGDREKCLQAGMDDYLPKPVQRNALVNVLAQFLTSRVLVVDGDPASQNIFVRTLVEAGWQVTLAETQRSAMYEACLSHFDLIVFDLSTPELDGLEAVKTIRQLEEYSGQRTMIFGIGEQNLHGNLLEQGFEGYIQRPVTKDKILNQLESLKTTG